MPERSEKKVIIVVLISIATIILSGVALGYYYASLPEHHPQESRQGCESVGGDWLGEKGKCLLSYKKTGEPCRDGGQCKSGVCFPPVLTEAQEMELAGGLVDNVVGTCYAEELVLGCVKQVLMGTVTKQSMCLED